MDRKYPLTLFLSRYRRLDTLPSNYIKDAEAFEQRLADEGEIEWSPICEDGDMLALTQLFSENLVRLGDLTSSDVYLSIHTALQISISVDTSVTRAGRPYTDYRTRKIGKP